MRFRAVDAFRGLAAIMVILFHLQHLTILAGNMFIAQSDIFVDFFFVLSGFVITHSNFPKLTDLASVQPFMSKRFKRLYPLHVFTLLLVLLFEGIRLGVDRYVTPLTNTVFGPDRTWQSFLGNLALVQSLGLFDRVTWNGPSWSISVEFYTYLAWALCLVLFRKNLWAMCGVCFSLLAWFIVAHHGSIIFNYDYGFVRCCYSFLIGMLTYRLSQQLRHRRLSPGLETVLESLLVVGIVYAVSTFTHGYSWLMPWLFALVILVFSREEGRVSKRLASNQLAFLGRLSYSYYLTHYLVLNVLDLIVFKVLHVSRTPLGEWVYLLSCLGTVHLFSVFTYRYIELILLPGTPNRSTKPPAEITAF